MGRLRKVLVGAAAALATLAAGLVGAGTANAATHAVSADDLAVKQSITVTGDSDISNRKLVAIDLAEYSSVESDGTNMTGYDLRDGGRASDVAAAISAAGISTTPASGYAGPAYSALNPMAWVAYNLSADLNSPWAGRLRDMLTKLQSEPGIQSDSGTALTPVSGDNTKQTVSGLTPGLYLILDRTNPIPAHTNLSIAMLVGTPVKDGTTTLTVFKPSASATPVTLGQIDLKATSTPAGNKKEVSDENPSSPGTTSDQHAVGDTVEYRLEVTVPVTSGYSSYYLALSDTLSKGLTFGQVKKVTVTEPAASTPTDETSDNTVWKLNPAAPAADATTGKTSFSVLLAPVTSGTPASTTSNILSKPSVFKPGAKVDVWYTATLNKNAASTSANNVNELVIDYSHDPHNPADHDHTPGTDTHTYTGKFTLDKQDMGGHELAGAKFQITKQDSTAKLKFIPQKDASGKITGYRLADATEQNAADATDTLVAGNIVISGVDGKYTVTETESPLGNPILPSFDVTVNVETADSAAGVTPVVHAGDVNVTTDGDSNHFVAAVKASDRSDDVVVKNAHSLVDMPKTGAAWLLIYAIGVLITGLAALLLLRSARKQRQQEQQAA